MDQEILTGEAPDPTSIPVGCRFHPRCPLVRDGQAEALGVAGACQSQDVALGRPGGAGRRLPRGRAQPPPLRTVGVHGPSAATASSRSSGQGGS